MNSKFTFRSVLLLTVLLLSTGAGGAALHTSQGSAATGKNVILLVGDGMGWNQILAGMLVEYGNMSASAFAELSHVNITTLNVLNETTDSAAAATALATGIRTLNGYVGVDRVNKDLLSITEEATHAGLETGLLTTVYLEHATPAAFAAHHYDRDDSEEIAHQMARSGVSLLMGGGSSADHFGGEVDYMAGQGYGYVTDESELLSATELPVLGLFRSGSMPEEETRSNDEDDPQLSTMLDKSLQLLSASGDGFFVMAEGGKIDWAGHGNDFTRMVHEMIQFEKTVRVALEFARNDPNTLVVVTADHETGDLVNVTAPLQFSHRLPGSQDSTEVKAALRTNRSMEMGYQWQETYHSNQEVILGTYGPGSDLISGATHLTDVHSVVRQVLLGSAPPQQGTLEITSSSPDTEKAGGSWYQVLFVMISVAIISRAKFPKSR